MLVDIRGGCLITYKAKIGKNSHGTFVVVIKCDVSNFSTAERKKVLIVNMLLNF